LGGITNTRDDSPTSEARNPQIDADFAYGRRLMIATKPSTGPSSYEREDFRAYAADRDLTGD
jgi:hypothetical protein